MNYRHRNPLQGIRKPILQHIKWKPHPAILGSIPKKQAYMTFFITRARKERMRYF
jgi:hypothetical protein